MKALKHLNKYFIKYKWHLISGVLFVTFSNLFSIFPAQLIRYTFDMVEQTIIQYQLLNGFDVQNEFYGLLSKSLLLAGGVVLLLALLKGVFLFFTRQTVIVMSRLIEYDLKNEIFEHYQELSLAFYKRNKTGDLMNRISEDVSRVRMYTGPAIMYSLNLLVLFVLVITTMLTVNVKLTLYVLLPLPLLSISIYYVSNVINIKSEKVQRQLSVLNSFVQEAFSGIRVLKAYNRDVERDTYFNNETEKYKDTSLELVKVNALFAPLMTLLIGLSTILTVYIGGQLAIDNEITTGNIAEFVIYVNMLTWPVASLGWVTSLTQRAAASQERINEFLHTVPEVQNEVFTPTAVRGGITFKDVSFTYPDSGIQAIKDLNFTVNPGDSLAIIGRTGSGKSTIANLICRLFDVDEGTIEMDGTPIKSVNLSDLRSSIGYVPQEVFLFSDSIRNNIAFGLKRDEYNEEDVITAAKQAEVYHNIADFPKGMDTILGERGITLSGGQKQRVSIARAIIRQPQILILDDALSAVDTETEEKIIQHLKPIMEGKTTLIISHRVSSVKHCNKIIVLEDGTIAEEGNHTQLIDKQGIYFDLFQQQLLEEEKA
ncbi:MAG: ABC transporter [Crocinitomicaceae bacterium]|nr:ABC transporter [Crocinitomicaceae bacterium]|tara:strand:- start:991 stop:2781 length:1791 start_codon:yes stop_codon:yes gene_type:complete